MKGTHAYLSVVVGCLLLNVTLSDEITVATCNLWNVMFNWNVRKYRIAQMIQDAQPDVVVFQEVRFYMDKSRNQITDLQELLSDYKWRLFQDANSVQKPKGAHWPGWEREGIGILSRRPITLFSRHTLPAVPGPDTNSRVVILAKVFISPELSVQVAALHLSYDRHQQCGNTQSVIRLIREQENTSGHVRSIVLGDFNTYNDFDWPVKLFTLPDERTLMECKVKDEKFLGFRGRTPWKDMWEVVGHPTSGRTFSNMPTPGYESRPDRILATSDFTPHRVYLQGNGTVYKKHYYNQIVMGRLRTVISSAYQAWYGMTGYPCFHDCGPRGVCRCGVCVRGDNSVGNTCLLQECEECSSRTFINVVIFLTLSIFTSIHLLYSIICLLISGADFKGEAMFAILGCHCCLCSPDNFQSPNFNSRKYRLFRGVRKWPPFRLPPYVLFSLTVILAVLLLMIGWWNFQQMYTTVFSIMDEEFYPSDHLMLIAKLQIAKSSSLS